jgi:uncharacterized membrane protein YgaE (UPF0421/DUF939 family)
MEIAYMLLSVAVGILAALVVNLYFIARKLSRDIRCLHYGMQAHLLGNQAKDMMKLAKEIGFIFPGMEEEDEDEEVQ